MLICFYLIVVKFQSRGRNTFDFSSDSFKLTDYTNHSAVEEFQGLQNLHHYSIVGHEVHVWVNINFKGRRGQWCKYIVPWRK